MEKIYKRLEGCTEAEKDLIFFRTLLEANDDEMKSYVYDKLSNTATKPASLEFKASIVRMMRRGEAEAHMRVQEFLGDDEYYKRIISKTTQLFDELNVNKSIDIASLFTVLVSMGYFSKEKQFEFGTSSQAFLSGFASHEIMTGLGCDVSAGCMLSDLLNQFSFPNSNVVASKPGVPYNGKHRLSYPLLAKVCGNRMFNLINDGELTYIYDSTDGCCYDVDSKKLAHNIVNGTTITIKPLFSYSFNFDKENNFQALDCLNKHSSFVSVCDNNEFQCAMDYATDLAHSCQKYIDDFYDDIESDINEVDKAMQLIKAKK